MMFPSVYKRFIVYLDICFGPGLITRLTC
uniref:Uncharacterized protein n=1 Tax=Anguilla anguilla TaxID=7936 RepID=A0A0E9S753_ANGAN